MQRLPSIEIVGSGRNLPADSLAMLENDYYEDQHKPLPGEIEPTAEQLEQIERTNAAILEMGREHDLDLSRRVLRPEGYHFFASGESIVENLQDVAPSIASSFTKNHHGLRSAAQASHIGIVINNERYSAATLVHEAVHTASHRSSLVQERRVVIDGIAHKLYDMRLKPYGHNRVRHGGRNSYNLVDEARTDWTMVRLNRHYGVLGEQRERAHYPESLIVLDELDTKICAEVDAEPADFLIALEHDGLTGGITAMRAINRYLTQKALADGENTTTYSCALAQAYPKDALDLAIQLRLDDAVDAIHTFRRNHDSAHM